MTDIHVRSFTGPSLKPYLHSIAKLRMDVFREYPYLEEPNLERETQYLRKIASHKESIGVLIFDNTTLVGASLGYPLALEDEPILRPFNESKIDPVPYYFFADSALLKQYRGRGIGHHFYDARETHVAQLKKYKYICFCVPEASEKDPDRPKDYISLHDFWRKRGYVHHHELKCAIPWKRMGEEKPTFMHSSYWIKNL